MKAKRIATKSMVIALAILMLFAAMPCAFAHAENAGENKKQMQISVFVDQRFTNYLNESGFYTEGDTVQIQISNPVPGRVCLDDKVLYELKEAGTFEAAFSLTVGDHTLHVFDNTDLNQPVYTKTFHVLTKNAAYRALWKEAGELFLKTPGYLLSMGPAVIAPPFALIALGIVASAFMEFFHVLGQFKNLF